MIVLVFCSPYLLSLQLGIPLLRGNAIDQGGETGLHTTTAVFYSGTAINMCGDWRRVVTGE